MTVSLVNWSVQWATPGSQRTPETLNRIGQHAPDVVCLTETHIGLLSEEGHVVRSQSDSGYGPKGNMRKVMPLPREPRERIDDSRRDRRWLDLGTRQYSIGILANVLIFSNVLLMMRLSFGGHT